MTGQEEETRLAAYVDELMGIWRRIAPTYVQADVTPLRGHLRSMFHEGVTPQLFEENLELSFRTPGVTKRQALNHAYRLSRIGESDGT